MVKSCYPFVLLLNLLRIWWSSPFIAWSLLYWWLRPLIKWFLRRTTKLCELQRICYGEPAGAARCCGVERSLELSRTPEVKMVVRMLDNAVMERTLFHNFGSVLDHSVGVLMTVKQIHPRIHHRFPLFLRTCLQQVWCYKLLITEVEDLRKTAYDDNNLDHETRLLELWASLMPNEPLEGRITKQWQDIGFQGDDPKTDFRGMGLLGLENLLYFSKEYPQVSTHVLSHSHHPTYGYTFAIVGINITAMAYHLLKDNSAKTYMYNSNNPLDIKLFHRFYCYLFYEFDKLWIESKPQNIMEFSVIYKRFENQIRIDLADPASVFRIKLGIDNI